MGKIVESGKKMKNIEKIDDLKFNLNDDMSNMIIEILIIKQKLKESSLSEEDRKLLENHKSELLKLFKCEFQRNNKEQIKQYSEFMNK